MGELSRADGVVFDRTAQQVPRDEVSVDLPFQRDTARTPVVTDL